MNLEDSDHRANHTAKFTFLELRIVFLFLGVFFCFKIHIRCSFNVTSVKRLQDGVKQTALLVFMYSLVKRSKCSLFDFVALFVASSFFFSLFFLFFFGGGGGGCARGRGGGGGRIG